jgi:hypothetical protein
MSHCPFVSPATRLSAIDRKTTKRPFAETDAGEKLLESPCTPTDETLARTTVTAADDAGASSATVIRVPASPPAIVPRRAITRPPPSFVRRSSVRGPLSRAAWPGR